ncbi:MAG TPA: chorismate mutase [Candidatus Acidoferrales bacterium]|jgi:chorismate mutase|nr:chorismate mutase [Candidatus Acidoferrales bacterium]
MIEEVRSEVASIDEQIVELIARRTDLALQILQAKRADGFAQINDEKQNKRVLDRAVDLATERNIDAGSVKRIFEILIAMNLEMQHGLSGEGNLP